MDRAKLLSGIGNSIQPLKTPNNAENLSPVNQQSNPEQAKDPPAAKPQTTQPETERQVLTDAQFAQRPHRHRQLRVAVNRSNFPGRKDRGQPF